jgi:hypothetical protein
VATIARENDVKPERVYEWMREDEEFQQLVEDAETSVVEAIISAGVDSSVKGILQLAPLAKQRLEEALADESPRVYLPAVAHVLRYLGATTGQTSLEASLATLDAEPLKGD